jgi:D-amino-acid dehydrogenase
MARRHLEAHGYGRMMGAAAEPCDVLVIGGGLVGMSLAYELVCRGLDVVLVDRHHQGRATDAGAGILSPETFLDSDDAWAELALAAGEHHHELTLRVAEDGAGGTDGGGTGHEVCGLIRLSTSEGEDEWLAKGAELAERRSPGVVTAIEPDEAVSLFPPLALVRGALFNPRAARIDGRRATEAIERAASMRGLRRVEGEVISLLLDGDRTLGAEFDTGSVAAGSVAIAGGAWSSRFAGQLRTNLPISPMKGQIIHMTMPGVETGHWPIVQPVFSHYLVPWPGGRVACGGTLEADAGFDTSPTAGGVFELLREGLRTAPGLAGATVSEVRVGLRPASKDDRPVLGRLDGWSNVYVATGHGTEGLLLGPYTAALVADSIVSGAAPESIAGLSPARFTA